MYDLNKYIFSLINIYVSLNLFERRIYLPINLDNRNSVIYILSGKIIL